jgi:hypothetical protein
MSLDAAVGVGGADRWMHLYGYKRDEILFPCLSVLPPVSDR